MKQNLRKLTSVAHPAYLDGLAKTGISIESIPSIDEMNVILSKLGWAAVAVDGFIPPSAFMEFQKHKVLVIAADIRPVDQIEYTPAPDIIHEAAGHAPIIVDQEYADYLRNFGEIGSKAFSSKKDYELYEAIRHLSILKADPHSPIKEIMEAEASIEHISKNMGIPSEMALIRNLHWWTVEYGLIGHLENPKVYGAGLLSSIGECSSALKKEVTKLPYSIDAIHYNFDITKPQPQLFVTPDFAYLNQVLEAFASQMALRKGGLEGLLKAIESENTATAVFTSGLQVSGTFSEVLTQNSEIVYLKTSGNTILCFNDKVLPGHGKEYHSHGFGSPVGRIKGSLKPPRLLSEKDLSRLGIIPQQQVEFEFESGVKVSGTLRHIVRKEKHNVLMSFENCMVQYQGKVLFEPSWGIYDMAVGEHINSVYSGPADPVAYGLQFEPPNEKTHKIQYTEDIRKLHQIYSQIKDIRSGIQPAEHLHNIWKIYRKNFKSDWLLASEMLEVSNYNELSVSEEIAIHLKKIKKLQPEFEQVISNVLEI
jgi:phenylalanine-4-hydroxylase